MSSDELIRRAAEASFLAVKSLNRTFQTPREQWTWREFDEAEAALRDASCAVIALQGRTKKKQAA